MGWHNRVLDNAKTIENEISCLMEQLGDDTSKVKDLDEVVKHALNIQSNANELLMEIYQSNGPFIRKGK